MAATKKYYRVMHHIGLSPDATQKLEGDGAAVTGELIRGGSEDFNIITLDQLPEDIDTDRLIRLGALRPATSEEIEKHQGGAGSGSVDTTTGNTTLHGTDGSVANTGEGDNKLTKGELSEFTVIDLREMAKERNIEGYSSMNKAELLDALTK